MLSWESLFGWQVAPLLAFDIWDAMVAIVPIILLVLSQVLGGKDKKEVKQAAEQQRRRAQQQQPGQPQADPVQQEIDDFLRRASGEAQAGDARAQEQQREQQQREPQRRAELERHRRQEANQPELQRRNYDPMAEGSAHYQRKPAAQQRGGQQRGGQRQQPVEAEIVEAVVVAEPVADRATSRPSEDPARARVEGIGSEHYDNVDSETARLDAGEVHTYDIAASLDNPLAVGGDSTPHDSFDDEPSNEPQIDFAAAIAGVFRDPEQAKIAIISREILERPDFDRW